MKGSGKVIRLETFRQSNNCLHSQICSNLSQFQQEAIVFLVLVLSLDK